MPEMKGHLTTITNRLQTSFVNTANVRRTVKIFALVSLLGLLAQGSIAQTPKAFPGITAVGQSSQQLSVAIVINGNPVTLSQYRGYLK